MFSSFKSHAAKFVMVLALVVAFAFLGNVDASAKVKWYKVKGKWVGFDKSTGYLKWSGGLSYVPKKIDGKNVKTIGEWAYSGNKNIKTANIPSSVKKIEKGAFYGCPKLTKVVLPKKVKMGNVEDNRIFWECNKLKTVVNNPDKEWKARAKTFNDTLDYLNSKGPEYFLANVRSAKNQWITSADGSQVYYTDEATDEAWAVIEAKAAEITKGCTTDMQKAKAISKWIVNYLHYDTEWMKKYKEWRKTHNPDKETFPIRKVNDAYGLITWNLAEHDGETAMTTCGGYGNITQALFCAAGIPCVHIHRVQKEGETIDHVFNVAYISGKWRWIDNTYSEENLNYFDCEIMGFSASDHRCDRVNLEYLSDLKAKE